MIRLSQTFTIFSIVLFLNSLSAQQTAGIRGRIIDSVSREPLDFASVSVVRQADKQPVKGGHTNESGAFLLDNLPAGTYVLRVGYLGYTSYERVNIILTNGQRLDVGTIPMRVSADNVLQEVVIEGTRPDMEIGIDRRVFNVAQSLVSEGGSATDLLANVPSLQVDMEGSVSLRGSGVRILIDGKPSAMGGSDITQLLQSMPANSIERIEVISNPSSKYDAEGQSGIVNIVLKKNMRGGTNGMVNISGGSYHNYNAGINLNHRNDRVNYFGSYNFSRRVAVGDGLTSTTNLSTNGITDNNIESSRKGLNHSVKAGVDYSPADKTTLSFSGDVSVRGNDRGQDIFYNYINQPNFTGNSTRLTRQDENDFDYDLRADFMQDFKRKGENLMFNFSYGRSTESGTERFDQTFTDPGTAPDRRVNDTDEDGRNLNIQADYTLPFDENHKFEAGYRSSVRRSDEHQFSERFDPASGQFTPDYDISNDFDLEDIVHAVYSNYQNKITDKLGFQIGLRAEQAYLNTEYFSPDPSLPVGERSAVGRLDYFRVYPSVFLTQELNNGHQLQASYTRRVSRPRGWQVNPFINVSDPMNIRQGNPNLLPEDIHSFEFSYAKFWKALTFTSSLYYRRINDVVEMITERADDANGVTFSKWQNLTSNDIGGLELISKLNLNRNYDATANVNVFYNKFSGSEQFNIPSVDGYNWNANLTNNIKITNSLSSQIRAEYNAPRVRAQGRTIATFVMDAGLKLDVMNKKGSVMLNVRDLFNQRRFGGTTRNNLIVQQFEHRWMRRMAILSFSYRFGRDDMNQKKRRNDNRSGEDYQGGEEF